MTARKTATTTRRGNSRKKKTRKLTRQAISQVARAINRAINRVAKGIVNNQPGREEFLGAEMIHRAGEVGPARRRVARLRTPQISVVNRPDRSCGYGCSR